MPDVVNVEGGAIAHGHPIGASGAVLTTRLLHSMKRDGVQKGIVTLCIGGGQGIALALEIHDLICISPMRSAKWPPSRSFWTTIERGSLTGACSPGDYPESCSSYFGRPNGLEAQAARTVDRKLSTAVFK